MTETQKTLEILKARWPEAFLIVGFSTLGNKAVRLITSSDPDSTLMDILGCSTVFFSLSLMLISIILNFGFLRTVHLEGSKKHTPEDLLKTGKRFFWRMVGFGIICGILYLILNGIILLIIKNFTSIEAGPGKLAKSNPLLFTLSTSLSMLILMKLVVLTPAIIIVLDCRVSDTLDFLKKCKLSDSKELIALYILELALPFVWVLLKISPKPETISHHISGVVVIIIQQVLSLIIAVMAVRFVGSLNLVYDRNVKDSNSEELLENPKEE